MNKIGGDDTNVDGFEIGQLDEVELFKSTKDRRLALLNPIVV